MSYEKGSLSIHSENIFPIIKKWLYSDHDIFIRELISNACDAITKVKRLSSMGEADLGGDDDFKVRVVFDKSAKTLRFIDNGIGMTADEIKKYINQIAFSGAEDFIHKYKDKADMDQIIGHFGLGFYSAFMVSEKVEINTLSHEKGAQPVRWICSGGTDFEMEDGDKQSRGTEITLHLGEEGKDFNDEFLLKSTIEKYCSFMPYPIYFETASDGTEKKEEAEGGEVSDKEELKPLNVTEPLYARQPGQCTDEEYKEFYMSTFMDFKEPLFWIHLNMDYPFNLKGILYFPRINTEFESLEGKVKLYNNQVFVADNVKEVIPEFLLLLKGVIDCPDLPLNVSRSFLQNDGFARKISDYISKKVADKLNSRFKDDRVSYEETWDDISPFIKFGSLKDNKFYDKVKDSIVYKTSSDEYVTLPEYAERFPKAGEKKVYYTTSKAQQAQYIQLLQSHEIESLLLDHSIDPPFISLVESKNEGYEFLRVDSDLSDIMKDDEHEESEEARKEKTDRLTEMFKSALGLESINIKLESLKTDEVSGMIILSESNRRMQDMMRMYGMSGMDPSMFPSNEILVLNTKNELVKYLLDDEQKDESLTSMVIEQVYDLAQMSHKPLTADGMTAFINRSNQIMRKLIHRQA